MNKINRYNSIINIFDYDCIIIIIINTNYFYENYLIY